MTHTLNGDTATDGDLINYDPGDQVTIERKTQRSVTNRTGRPAWSQSVHFGYASCVRLKVPATDRHQPVLPSTSLVWEWRTNRPPGQFAMRTRIDHEGQQVHARCRDGQVVAIRG